MSPIILIVVGYTNINVIDRQVGLTSLIDKLIVWPNRNFLRPLTMNHSCQYIDQKI